MHKAFVVLLLFRLLADAAAVPPQEQPRLHAVAVMRPNIVVRGAYLGKVEIWSVPAGTEITEDAYALLGTAKRRNYAGPSEIWMFRISCTSPLILSTEVFAKAFDTEVKEIATKSLPYRGATDIVEALCGPLKSGDAH